MAEWSIWHNPRCGTSRTALALLREAGIEPQVIEYLKTPPDRRAIADACASLGIAPSALLRRKEPLASELGLLGGAVSEAAVLEAMAAHPLLIERPVVFGPAGARLGRPAERVRELLPAGG
ncbi:arsenate reductase (glutaredoxin) [Roseomonas sp. OT10]|uniref:arsenate reductase (glutaredoxin) n=1 Tax=Roseomonas cutis TaxID=2897332 RepID=UPI001E64024F|nr:arsenate reductase (glutaredoxin) [Roseomonas sp. OT10]UFN50866.1 arsenate reductase (glutaredoxin) [Roseomonas sp. OT10]